MFYTFNRNHTTTKYERETMNKCPFIINFLLVVTLVGVLSGCQQEKTISQSHKMMRPLRIPTAASLYCVKKGGTLSMTHTEKKGDIRYCHLPDGRVIEEWAFFNAWKNSQNKNNK